jgi:hypothetical protein
MEDEKRNKEDDLTLTLSYEERGSIYSPLSGEI